MSVETLLSRLNGVRKTEHGWRANCPNGHKSAEQTLSITERDGVVLFNCFACHDKPGILACVGLEFSDLFPDRHKATSEAERRAACEAFKRNSWAAALRVLYRDGITLLVACAKIGQDGQLSEADYEELRRAFVRIRNATEVLS